MEGSSTLKDSSTSHNLTLKFAKKDIPGKMNLRYGRELKHPAKREKTSRVVDYCTE